ncbi:hypothetical protein PGT21_003198 [Puccinia graminis f. sp. tritici]|uniref:Uncharacterized protein n=1 Tax=Puccinia graminis f. sp. tritici TaxID=56615 RepID=A0A5B0MBG8_PUCGR|nr:hypothetical protein PGT21_003198 [Puccinia graminis f. sp. tritici]
MRASASHRIERLSHRIGVSDAGPRIASSASEKPMRRIGIASVSRCDARYFAGDADVIGRHRLNLGFDCGPELTPVRESLRVQLESNFKRQFQIQSIPDLKLNTTLDTFFGLVARTRHWNRLRNRFVLPSTAWNRIDSYSPRWSLTRAVINWSTDPIGIERKHFGPLPSPGPISSLQLFRTPKNTGP